MQYLKNYDMFINEGLFSEKTLYHKYELWDYEESNILLICGLSGSGKSTLGIKIAQETGATYIELDEKYDKDNVDNPDNEIWLEFIKTANIREGVLNSNNEIDADVIKKGKETRKLFKDFFIYRWKYLQTQPNKRFILEGIQLCWLDDLYPEFVKHSIVVLGTGLIKSAFNALKRYNNIFEIFRSLNLNLKDVVSKLDDFRNYIKAQKPN